MTNYAEQLRETFRGLDTEELLDRLKSGTLTAAAHAVALEELAARGVATTSLPQPQNPITASATQTEGYVPQYGAAQFIGRLRSFVGWVVLVLGVVGGIVGVSIAVNLATASGFDPARQMLIGVAAAGSVFSLQFALIGLLLAGAGQHFRATADNANYNGEMLTLMKSGKA